MSKIALAELIDELVTVSRAFVVESEENVTISGLSARDAADLRDRSDELEWDCELFDSAGLPLSGDDVPDPEFASYRFVVRKPPAPANTLRLLTNAGFARWLQHGHPATHWQIARMTGTLTTNARVLQPWDELVPFDEAPSTKSPRALVHEYGPERKVPADIRPWLALSIDPILYNSPSVNVWVRAAASTILMSLADEVGLNDGALKFRGPPRLTLPSLALTQDLTTQLPHATFMALQGATQWVYENEREAEMRHILLATEFARCSAVVLDTSEFLREHASNAWESAKIAYQMALSDTSRDTLKLLTELRKAITEETSKVSDLSRQLMAAVASALALGIGLVAARVATGAHPTLIAAVMVVVAVYVLVVILSGFNFIRLQRQLRSEWQPKLYRFLAADDYSRMVSSPAAQAERSFIWTSILGGAAVLTLTAICVWPSILPHASGAAHARTQETSASKSTVAKPVSVQSENASSAKEPSPQGNSASQPKN